MSIFSIWLLDFRKHGNIEICCQLDNRVSCFNDCFGKSFNQSHVLSFVEGKQPSLKSTKFVGCSQNASYAADLLILAWKNHLNFVANAITLRQKHILVLTFLDDSHFSPYILFLLLLVLILKKGSRFGPCCYSFNRNILCGKQSNSKCWRVY